MSTELFTPKEGMKVRVKKDLAPFLGVIGLEPGDIPEVPKVGEVLTFIGDSRGALTFAGFHDPGDNEVWCVYIPNFGEEKLLNEYFEPLQEEENGTVEND